MEMQRFFARKQTDKMSYREMEKTNSERLSTQVTIEHPVENVDVSYCFCSFTK